MMFDCRNDIIAKFTFSSQRCSALSEREKFVTKCMVTMYHSCGSLQKKTGSDVEDVVLQRCPHRLLLRHQGGVRMCKEACLLTSIFISVLYDISCVWHR